MRIITMVLILAHTGCGTVGKSPTQPEEVSIVALRETREAITMLISQERVGDAQLLNCATGLNDPRLPDCPTLVIADTDYVIRPRPETAFDPVTSDRANRESPKVMLPRMAELSAVVVTGVVVSERLIDRSDHRPPLHVSNLRIDDVWKAEGPLEAVEVHWSLTSESTPIEVGSRYVLFLTRGSEEILFATPDAPSVLRISGGIVSYPGRPVNESDARSMVIMGGKP